VLFAFVPPTAIAGGWLTFFVSLLFIAILTAIVGDVAAIFGCLVGLKDSITAISFVALGTSLPDTFASMIAAKNSKTADDAIGNVTGSNSVNVFLGLGLPWLVAASYWEWHVSRISLENEKLLFYNEIYVIKLISSFI
jgi:solute carrier family 8 (sodium/calcium exchanger)